MFVGAWLQQPPLWTGTLNMINQYECPSGFAVERMLRRMLHIFCGATCLSLHQILLNMFPVHRSVKRKALKRLQTALFEVVKENVQIFMVALVERSKDITPIDGCCCAYKLIR